MIQNLTFFENAKELETLTGLSHEELWDNGFNLDDMDWGFVTDICPFTELENYSLDYNNPSYICHLIDMMGNYCVGYHYTEFKGKHYLTLHHA